MIVITADSAESLFLKGLRICKSGVEVAPRGTHTLEARDSVTFELTDTRGNLVTNPYRKLNYAFGLFESIAMWCGVNNVDDFDFYNKNMSKFSDDGKRFFGSYGDKFTAQLHYLLTKLNTDRDSRQAVINIWRESPAISKDIPCTIMLHFMIRDFHLNLNVYMRSNDIWLGFPYDITNFSRIQQAVASLVGVKVGILRHVVGSLHMYSGDIYKAENALRYQGVLDCKMPNVDYSELGILYDIHRQYKDNLYKVIDDVEKDFGKSAVRLIQMQAYIRGLVPNKPDLTEPYKSIIEDSKRVHGYFKDCA